MRFGIRSVMMLTLVVAVGMAAVYQVRHLQLGTLHALKVLTNAAPDVGERLLKEGEDVRVLEHPSATVDHLPLDRIELVRADIRDRAAVREAARECEYVYHLAADPNLWRRDRREFDSVNHVGTINVVRAALENCANRVLYTSTESILTSSVHKGGAVENLQINVQKL